MAVANLGSDLIGFPAPGAGSSGDIQLRLDGVPKMFSKIGDTWYQNALFTPGNGLEKTTRGLSVKVNGKSVATFGNTIAFDTRATGSDVPLKIINDGAGYSQIMFSGANPEILLGYSGSGASPTGNIEGSAKIFLNMAGDSDNLTAITFARASSNKFAIGSTYEASTDELRIVYDADGGAWIEEIVYEPDKKDKSGARVKFKTRRMK